MLRILICVTLRPITHAVIDGAVAEVIESIIYDHTKTERANFIKPGMRYTFDGQLDSAYLFSENTLV